ncbi:AAA family ATPase [Prescottella equi]|uniref:AAA family ATPase n=1 Tax=Rhodococcus hoagii TaxID=43767 RepID=UPI000A0FC2C6|nr:AAA family ATPase [Prescottella equi]
MGTYTEHNRDLIDSTIDRLKARCLLDDKSLLFDDDELTPWALSTIEDLNRRFNGNPLEGQSAGGRFTSKWAEQLSGASTECRVLGAELLLIHFLFPSSVTSQGKIGVIERSLAGTDIKMPVDVDSIRAMGQGIGNPGIGFNTRRDLQVGYLIDFVLRFKRESRERRAALLDSQWDLRDFADDTDHPVREMRHILLHLLRPDAFERISSGTHKREIAAAFADFLPVKPPEDVDERLLHIRGELARYVPGEIDFYMDELRGVWSSTTADGSEGVGDLEALRWKKQIVFYGPPGTSKTWQAAQLAQTLIRRAALEAWGPEAYFTNADVVDAAVRDNVFWLQLHPGYGYEQFIRGLRLEGDVTRYRPGFLPWMVEKLGDQKEVVGDLTPLPGVLVLDEINRTNLSEMLGEAFSLLENGQRGTVRELPGFDHGQEPSVLVIPENLYVIGTMNEIDQSVETLDFALRRRFLWRECPFERDTLLAIVADRWGRDVARFTYDDAAPQLERFAEQVQALNDAIAESEELGRQFQIGHTYFADIAFFIGAWVQGRSNRPPNGTYLWTSKGKPQPPLLDLWRRSLEPLIEQYLAGSDVRDSELKRFRQVFLG